MLDDPAMNVVYEAMTDAANAAAEDGTFTTDDANSFLYAMLTSEDTTCPESRYLIFTEVHSHEDGMEHFHMRYGNTSFDDLLR
jgi:hypothetical protein